MKLVGSSVQRIEDARILAGRGSYIDDLKLPGMLHVAFVRSAHPHGRIARIDTTRARAAAGVVAVFTSDDMVELTDPMRAEVPDLNHFPPPFWPLARDKVRFVGDPIAMIVAETRALAEDAGELVQVEIEPLQAIATIDQALDESRARVFDELESNVTAHKTWEYGDVDAAFASADRVISHTFDQHRWANVPLEGRGIVATYSPAGGGELTLHCPCQSPHWLRVGIAGMLRQPMHLIRVVAGDIGGSFGLKANVHREYVAVAAASIALGRPIKWTEDRTEHLQAAGHARSESVTLEAAVRNDGTLLGFRAHMRMDIGAYPGIPLSAPVFAGGTRILLPGPYRLLGMTFALTAVTTNKCTYVAFRGPWAVESWVREVMLDLIARELELDPLELRRLNTIDLDEQPTQMVTGPTHNGMTAELTLERAMQRIDYEGFRREQAEAREQGRYLGIGIGTFIEASPGPPDYRTALGFGWTPERAEARIEPDGNLTIVTAQSPHGQGHETTIAQIAADELDIPFEKIRVVSGDTRFAPFSLVGTGGSRAATMASGATRFAVRAVKQKALELAGHLLEASPDDLELIDGRISVVGTPQASIDLADVARTAYFAPGRLPPGMAPGLNETYDFKPDDSGWAVATHCCTVEVDIETGEIKILRYVVAEDCGDLINPAIVEGQVRGGTVHGISATLLEHAAYDEDGYFLTPSFRDYFLPTAMDVPEIEIEHLETPPIGEINYRGVGEGGAVGAPPAVTNAVADALAPFGGIITAMPITPERVLSAIGAIPPRPTITAVTSPPERAADRPT